ncbi:MAG: DUF3726 domain-containing protein [Rhizobiaceae bacterium]
MLSVSFNEIDALVKRAARGAGFPWGVAEEAGKAASWLCQHGLDGTQLLADALESHARDGASLTAPSALDGIWTAASGNLCPLMTGCTLADCARLIEGRNTIQMGRISYPAIIASFASAISAATGKPVVLAWGNASMIVDAATGIADASGSDLVSPLAESMELTLAPAAAAKASRPTERLPRSAMVNPQIWSRLNQLAERTFAPDTEASRVKGAGAGLNDND